MWDRGTVVLLIYAAVMTPFEVAFLEPSVNALFAVNRVVDSLFLIDIISQFFLNPLEDDSQKTKGLPDHRKIACHYLRGWCIIDSLGTIPFDLITVCVPNDSGGTKNLNLLRITRLFRLVKLVRLFRVSRVVHRIQDHYAINNASIVLVRAFCMTIAASHWGACIWYITSGSEGNNYSGWVGTDASLDNTVDLYIASWYFAVMTMSTIGYGDITATTALERIAASLMMLGGALFYAFVISSVTEIIMTMNARETNYKRLTDTLNNFLVKYNIKGDVRWKCRSYFRRRYDSHNGQYEELMNELSPDLRQQLAKQLHRDWGVRSEYFYNAPLDFYAKAAAMFVEVSYPVGEQIVQIGEVVQDLFILSRGLILCKGQIQAATHGANVCFAEDSLFWDRHLSGDVRPSEYVVLALSFVLVHQIPMDKMLVLLDEFPTVKQQVMRTALCNTFRMNVYCYSSAVRLRRGESPLPSATNLSLVHTFLWKLRLMEKGFEGQRASIAIQKQFRGHLARRIKQRKANGGAAAYVTKASMPEQIKAIQATLDALDSRLKQNEAQQLARHNDLLRLLAQPTKQPAILPKPLKTNSTKELT